MSRSKQPSVSSEASDRSTEGPSIAKPPLQFEGSPSSLADILDRHSLPRVIKCGEKSVPSKDLMRCNVDFTQPLLAYCRRSVRKVNAQSVVFDSNTKEFVTVGNNLLVPEDYPGWFAVLGSPDKVIADQKVPHFRSIHQLAISRCSQFLIAGMMPIHAILTEGRHICGPEARQIPISIPPGTVLIKGALYREQHPPGKNKKKKKQPPQRQFLMCTDEQGREMLVHTGQEGLFYPIAQDDVPVKHPIMQIKVLLERIQLPLLVKLVYGRVPSTPCAFTETLLLTNWGKNHTLVASTLFNLRNINIEIPIASSMLFHAAENTPGLLASNAYLNALSVCKDQIHSYVRNIKVIFGNPQLARDKKTETPRNSQTKESQEKPAGATANPSPQNTDETIAEDDSAVAQLRTPVRQASVVSRSQMATMLKRVTVTADNDSVFVPTPQHTPPPIRISGKQPPERRSSKSKSSNEEAATPPQNVRVCNIYVPPKPCVIPSKVVKSDRISQKGAIKREAFQGNDRHVYDDYATLSRQETPDVDSTPYVDSTPAAESQADDAVSEDAYLQIWGTDQPTNDYEVSESRQSTTISIPFKAGQPQPLSPESDGVDPSYLLHPIYPSNSTNSAIKTQSQAERPKTPPKVLPKPSPHKSKRGSGDQSSASELPPVPPIFNGPPPLPRKKESYEVSFDDAKTLAQRESLSETSNDENIYINWNSLQEVGDKIQSESGPPTENYDKLAKPAPQLNNYGYTTPSQTSSFLPTWSNGPLNDRDGYLVPVDVIYNPVDELEQWSPLRDSTLSEPESGPYEEPEDMLFRPNSIASNVYVDIKDVESRRSSEMRPYNTDSGVYEEEESTTPTKDENDNIPSGNKSAPDFMKELKNKFNNTTSQSLPKSNSTQCSENSGSALAALRPQNAQIYFLQLDISSSNSETTNRSLRGPPLPRRNLNTPRQSPTTPQPATLGQAVLKSVSNPGLPKGVFSESNKEELIKLLKDSGISSSTELALQGLQLADITNLLQKEDDFDDNLIALLPKVGNVDLRKIAICLKGMNLSI